MITSCDCTIDPTNGAGTKPAGNCFLCGGSGMIGRSTEAQGWYKARKACLAKAQGNLAVASDLLKGIEARYDAAQRGQVRDTMDRACEKISFYRA